MSLARSNAFLAQHKLCNRSTGCPKFAESNIKTPKIIAHTQELVKNFV